MFRLLSSHPQALKMYIQTYKSLLHCRSPNACVGNSSSIQTCVPDGHLNIVTYTGYYIDTINYPDGGNIAVRNI